MSPIIKVGAKAPDFVLPASNGNIVNLTDFLGRKVVLYFYPKDNTPGCTIEAHDFAKHHAALLKLNTVVLGVSRDSIASHLNFAKKCELPFLLLADEDGIACKRYGVLKEKSMFGRKYMGIERSTFFINEVGIVQWVWRKVSVPEHVKAVVSVIEEGR